MEHEAHGRNLEKFSWLSSKTQCFPKMLPTGRHLQKTGNILFVTTGEGALLASTG